MDIPHFLAIVSFKELLYAFNAICGFAMGHCCSLELAASGEVRRSKDREAKGVRARWSGFAPPPRRPGECPLPLPSAAADPPENDPSAALPRTAPAPRGSAG